MNVVVISGSVAEPEDFSPAPERVLSGIPSQRTWNGYTDISRQFNCGIWQGEAGAWRVIYEAHEEEFCVLLEGHVRLTGDAGPVTELHVGDAFVIPGGFTGIWENIGRVCKHYAIMHLKI